MIIMPCFKRTNRAVGGALVVIAAGIPVAGCCCGDGAAAESIATPSSRVSERADSDVVHALEPDQRHFNIYKDFRAMFEASGGAQANAQDTAAPANAKIGIGRYFSCSRSRLIRLDD